MRRIRKDGNDSQDKIKHSFKNDFTNRLIQNTDKLSNEKLIDILYELVDKMIISKYFYVVVDSEYEQVDKHINLFVPDTTT